MSDPFFDALARAAASLIESPGVGGHVHFDDREFEGLVPDFRDPEWIHIAPRAASAVAGLELPFAVHIALCELEEKPADLSIEQLDQLEPWQPPALYVLAQGSAYDHRTRYWHSDDVTQLPNAVGWVGASIDDDPGRPSPVWHVSLFYETR